MSVNIRLPHITDGTEREQLIQVKRYLHQLAEQLNWAFDLVPAETAQTGATCEVQGQEQKKVNDLTDRMNRMHFKLDDGTILY